MTKNKIIIIWVAAAVVVIIVVAGVWWYFAKTNSVAIQANGLKAKSGSTTAVKSSDKSITSFAFPEMGSQASEVIDGASHTITIIVPSGTDVTSLAPAISIPGTATISPDSGAAEDFTNPVVYTVTAQDGSAQNYTVTVKVATPEGTGGS